MQQFSTACITWRCGSKPADAGSRPVLEVSAPADLTASDGSSSSLPAGQCDCSKASEESAWPWFQSRTLWQLLRRKQVAGSGFHRAIVLGSIPDFGVLRRNWRSRSPAFRVNGKCGGDAASEMSICINIGYERPHPFADSSGDPATVILLVRPALETANPPGNDLFGTCRPQLSTTLGWEVWRAPVRDCRRVTGGRFANSAAAIELFLFSIQFPW